MLDQHREDWGQVFIGPGIYRENIELTRDGMWLRPSKQYDVIIEGSIIISGRNNNVRGLTFRSLDKAIVVKASAIDSKIQHNRIEALSNGGVGLHLESGDLVIGNVIDLQACNAKETTGLLLQPGPGAERIRIDHNRIAGAKCGIKIIDPQSDNAAPWYVTHNEVRDCDIGVQGLLDHVTFRYNRIWRCHALEVGTSDAAIGRNAIYEISGGSRQTSSDADKNLPEAPSEKRTRYVQSEATGGGDGSSAHPFNTLAAGLADLLPGDTILVGPGNYRVKVTVSALAPKDAPILIRSSESHAAIIEEGSIKLEDCANVIIEGFRFIASPDAVSFGRDARHCAVRNCHLTSPESKLSSAITVLGPSASHNLIEDCILEGNKNRKRDGIHLDCQRFNQHLIVRRCKISGFYCAVQTGSGAYATAPPGHHIIEECEFFGNTDGVHCKMTDSIIRNCHLHHNLGFGLTVRCGCRQLIEGNRIHHNGTGIRLHSSSHLVRNNLIYQNKAGGIIATVKMGEPYYDPPTSIFIVNNTLWQNEGYAIRLEQGARLSWMRNIIVGKSNDEPLIERENTDEKADWDMSGIIRMADFNLYHQGTVPLLTEHEGGEHDLFADPGLVDPENGDFNLSANSPARNAISPEWSSLPPIPFGAYNDPRWLTLGATSEG